MGYQFDDYLLESAEGWQWRLPEKFNITQACVTRHVKAGQGDKLALIVEDHDKGVDQLTYGQLEEQSARLAALLDLHGHKKKSCVLIRLPNSVYYPISFFGCIRFGAIAVPTSTLLAPAEVAYLAKDSGAKVLITSKTLWTDSCGLLLENTELEAIYLVGDGAMPEPLATQSPHGHSIKIWDLEQALSEVSASSATVDSTPNDPAYLVYTSGTTGYPKGVLHAHRSLIGRLPASRFWFDFKPGDRIMHSGKFNWTYVLGSALMDPLFHGHTVIVHEGPNDATTWPKLIQKHQCSIFIGVPTIYRQIIQKTDYSGKDVPSLRHCMSAGEHLSDEMLLAWQNRFGCEVYEAIGMSEFSYYISQRVDQPIRPGAAGFIQPGHAIALLNDANRPVKVGEEGMIAIPLDDPGLFLNYWQLPEETLESRHDGYFFTGDFARQDEQGYIWFLGRKDDIINTFGYRVSPHEIERVMKTHPAVADCVALGEEVEKDKTLVSICVILAEGQSANENDLLAFANAQLAKYKAPKKVHFYQQFPRTKNGKVLRKQLCKDLSNQA